jgi:hypothetical protein
MICCPSDSGHAGDEGGNDSPPRDLVQSVIDPTVVSITSCSVVASPLGAVTLRVEVPVASRACRGDQDTRPGKANAST